MMISFDEAKDIYLNDIGSAGSELNLLVEKAAKSNFPILIQGENGTGKSIVAQAIHKKSVRNGRPFVSIPCGVFSSSDLSKEILGSLTLADSGTLLISGIEKIDPVIQTKLLDVMEGRYARHVDIRFIAITHVGLYDEVVKGNFSENLYHKMVVLPINLVSLRQRKDDIPLIALNIIKNNRQKDFKGFSEGALELLINHNWPGNMRELESVVKRAIVLSENDYILPRDIIFTKIRPQEVSFETVKKINTATEIKSTLTYSHILEMKDIRENILRNIMSGIITVDMKKKVTTFNKRAEYITGYKVADVLGRDVGIIGNKFAEIVSDTLNGGKIFSRVELKIPTALKEMVSIGMSTSHLKDESDNPVGVIIVFADLSEGAQIETQVRRTERLASLTTMATGLAHEIKNPLVSIKTFTHLLPQKFNDHEFRNNYYEVVSKEIERLDNLIEKLVNFSHLGVPKAANHNIEELIAGILSSLNDELITRKINIKRDYLDNVNDIFLDIEQMKIVFHNILLNAIESMPRGGDIVISLKNQKLCNGTFFAERDFVEITFQDTGCGICEENLNKVFNPFFTTKYGSVGLGLAIVHQVVEGHNGIIKIKSRENHGTTVSLSLPIKVTNYE